MCGRFNSIADPYERNPRAAVRKELRLQQQNMLFNNIAPGMLANIITAEGYDIGEFGFRPSWDIKKMFINARAEGKGNESNQIEGWEVGIHLMPAFKKAFAEKRCAIPVASFIEGPADEKLSKPYMILEEDEFLFYLGGIYRNYITEAGEERISFAIITTPATPICRAIGHHRSPLILSEDHVSWWCDPETDHDELAEHLINNVHQTGFKAVPLNPTVVKSGRIHDESVLKPIGEALYV